MWHGARGLRDGCVSFDGLIWLRNLTGIGSLVQSGRCSMTKRALSNKKRPLGLTATALLPLACNPVQWKLLSLVDFVTLILVSIHFLHHFHWVGCCAIIDCVWISVMICRWEQMAGSRNANFGTNIQIDSATLPVSFQAKSYLYFQEFHYLYRCAMTVVIKSIFGVHIQVKNNR